jgi:N-acetylglucosaminyl-diphospho-decaprenol L-rhamnosyltransferase
MRKVRDMAPIPADAAAAPRLSVIILNHNSGDFLRTCLDSIFAQPPPFPIEVIIPDNASNDSSIERAAQAWGGRIRILENGANRGFAWGNNRGIDAARGEYLCLLNPDTVVRPGALTALAGFLDANPRAGFVGPMVLDREGAPQRSAKRSIPTPFDAICRALLLSRLFPRSRRFARYEATYLDDDQSQRVEACDGCCMTVRRSVIDQIGKLDEGYFIYCEDVDWFMRAKWAGWEVWYHPQAVIEHHGAHTRTFRRYQTVRNFHDSMIRFHRKFYARQYPPAVNALIYGAVRTRMYLIMGWRTLTGWS